jgi:lysyl-tRNA synthetase class I
MPDYTAIRDMVSHRVTFEFDSGATIVGTIAACAPPRGPVQYVVLSKAQILDSEGQVLARFDELPVVPNSLVSFAVTEGPL